MNKIIVSACLVGIPCRYNATASCISELRDLYDKGEIIAVCPEVLGGLSTPRVPCEIQKDGRIINKNGIDCSDAFIQGAQKTLLIAQEYSCDVAILKSNSPSCGFGHIYDGTFTSNLIQGHGVCGKLLSDHHIRVYNEHNFKELL